MICRGSKPRSTSRTKARTRCTSTGEVSATVGQNCVVTLEPIENEIREGIDLVFASHAKGSIADSEGKITIDFNDPDSTEPMTAEASSISAPSRPNFSCSAIDPYPRKDGAVFDAPKAPEDPPSTRSPRLAALKKAGGGDKT